MADMMDTLKGLLGDNADEKLSGIMKILNPDGASETGDIEKKSENSSVSDTPSITPEMLMMAQKIMSRIQSSGDDDRTKLLLSLKPYMNDSRQSTIDSAIKLLQLSEVSDLFKGGIL